MSTGPKYKKHPNFVGKELTLYTGGGDKKVHDGEVLVGAQWTKFAGQGFLVEIKEAAAPAAPAAPAVPAAVAPAPAAAPAIPATKSDGGLTKSSAGKLGDALKAPAGKKDEKKVDDKKKVEAKKVEAKKADDKEPAPVVADEGKEPATEVSETLPETKASEADAPPAATEPTAPSE